MAFSKSLRFESFIIALFFVVAYVVPISVLMAFSSS